MTAAGGPVLVRGPAEPAAIADAKASALQSWWPSIDLDAAAIWQRDQSKAERSWEAMQNYARWCLLRRIYSQRQVLEVMTEFWENHLHVPLDDSGVFTYRADYGKLLHRHALGRFDEMLVAAITIPPWASRWTTPGRRGSRPTRTSAASSSSCTPSVAATTPRTT